MSDPRTASPPRPWEFIFAAAIAVVSRGVPLAEPVSAVFAEAMVRVELPLAVREALLERARAGWRAADLTAWPAPLDEELAFELLTALTLFGLRASQDEREALAVPERLAALKRWPHDLIPRISNKLSEPLARTQWGDLSAHLDALLQPEAGLVAIARWIGETLEPPQPARRSAAHVPTERFQHPLDVQATTMVSGIAGFDDLTRLIFKHGFEKIFRLVNLSSCVRVGPTQFPEIYRIFQACVERAGIRQEPELYLGRGGINAHTSGIERPYIMLDSGTISALSQPELEFLIGHELGHIRCQHLLYHFMAQYLPMLVAQLPVIGPWVKIGLGIALGEWRRKSELSCDRMGLLVCQDLEAALRVMIKWSGVPGELYQRIDVEAFLRQGAEFRELDSDLMSMVYKLLMTAGQSHPWTVERATELKRWYDEGGYEAAFAGAPDDSVPINFLPPGWPLLDAPAPAPDAASSGPPEPSPDEQLDWLVRCLASRALGPEAAAALAALQAEAEPGVVVVIAGAQARAQRALFAHLRPIPARWPGARLALTPPLGDAGPVEIEAVFRAVAASDVLLIALSAMQLLSAQERAAIRERLAPLAPGAIALVVCDMDQLETPEDREEVVARVQRFAAHLDPSRLAIVFLEDDPGLPALDAILTAATEAASEQRAARKRASALARLDAVLAGLDVPDGWQPPTAEDLAELERLFAAVQANALQRAEAALQERIAAWRLALPARLAGWSMAMLQHEGPAELTAEARRLGRELAETYLGALTREVVLTAPERLRPAAREAVRQFGALPGDRAGAAWTSAERPRDPGLATLTAIGAGLMVFVPGAVPLLGPLTLGAADRYRRFLDRDFEARVRQEALSAFDGWLVGLERDLRDQLRAGAQAVLETLQARAIALAETPPDATTAPFDPAALRALIRSLRDHSISEEA